MERRDRDKRLLYRLVKGLLADQGLHAAVDEIVAAINAERERLDELLRAQHYRLAFWRVVAQQLGYRRFFDVNTLLALRADAPAVVTATHDTLLRL
jgi:(1->4)-alpha-D-glucan 1-alpha-D-glucosylmutase